MKLACLSLVLVATITVSSLSSVAAENAPPNPSAQIPFRGLLSHDWELDLEDDYPLTLLNDTETDQDMIFRYNFTGSLGAERDYFKYISFALLEYDCDESKVVDPSVLKLSEATGQDLWKVIRASANDTEGEIDLYLTIDRASIAGSPYYQDGLDGLSATIQFCLRGDYLYDEDNNSATADESINFHETQVTINIDLTAGFELVALSIVRDGADEASANIVCHVQAYFCTDDRQLIDPSPSFQQGDFMQFCVEIAEQDRGRFWVRDIMRTDLDQDNVPELYRALEDEYDDIIQNFVPDMLTLKDCYSGICRIRTQLKSKYFAQRIPNPLDIFGTALCALGATAIEGPSGVDIPIVGPRTTIQLDRGFACNETNSMFTFNRDPVDLEYPKMMVHPGELADNNECFLRLTPDSANPRATSAFTDFSFHRYNMDKRFSMTASYRVYGDSDGSADGMTFVMHQDPRGLNALGGGGGSLGAYQRDTVAGIGPAIIVEWDTQFFDDGEDRIHIVYVDEAGDMLELAETGLLPIRTSADGATTGRIWIEYCDDDVLRVYLNSVGDEKPTTPDAFATVKIKDILKEGNDVFVGFTAGTWGAGDNHDILDWTLEQDVGTCEAIPGIARVTEEVAMSYSEIDNANGFPCKFLPFYINRGKNPVGLVFPSYVAYDNAMKNCFLRMTPDGVAPRGASAFLNFAFDEENTNKTFSMESGYRISGSAAGSANGMAFVMHQDPRGVYAVGNPGRAHGVHGRELFDQEESEMIKSAIVVGRRTHYNTENLDAGEDRIHIIQIDNMGNLTELAETNALNLRTSDLGIEESGRIWVDYGNDEVFRVYVNTTGSTKPLQPQAEANISLSRFFSGNDVVLGYTAETWAEADYQDILDWQFTQNSTSRST